MAEKVTIVLPEGVNEESFNKLYADYQARQQVVRKYEQAIIDEVEGRNLLLEDLRTIMLDLEEYVEGRGGFDDPEPGNLCQRE